MADYRAIPTTIWLEDEWFSEQAVDGRLLWLWMQTNSEASSSWQPLDTDRIIQEVRLSRDVCAELFSQFEKVGRIETAWIKGQPVFRIFLSDKRCAKCGAGADLTIDHITPRSWGGSSDKQNLQWLCRSCNSSKGNRHDTRY
jgi:5-methylcytosine-specific restriction endonuclease McrA